MAESGAICNSTRDHLKLDLETGTSGLADRDVEAGSAESEGEEAAQEQEANDEEQKELKPESKVPIIYQVEPGCTPMACYASIITFIIMWCGILWILLISPPKSAKPVFVILGEQGEYEYVSSGPSAEGLVMTTTTPDLQDTEFNTLMPTT